MTKKKSTSKPETKEFQAEVKKLLDIVIHSLYTEREIFLRELISNAADALEKFRHHSLIEEEVFDSHVPLEININVNKKEKILTITDTGIGMTKDELISNLGTIAHSGSKTFLTELADAAKKDVNLIGQFGVGFYSAFMVAKRVLVQSRSYKPEEDGHEWSSDASGSYTISEAPGIRRGTRIIIDLNDDAEKFADENELKRIIKQYSSFVPFPIKMDDETINTVQAIWARKKSDLKDEEYNEFYKFVANAIDDPFYRLHFETDAPLAIKALLFTPKDNFENMGFGRMEPGVSLYCQKVLIEQHSKNILPEWLRFLKGVIDSDDLPLNISRQALQDNALLVKLNKIITKRFLKHLSEEAKNNPEAYETFWKNFGIFLKEGATSDYTHREDISKLLRFESSKSEPGKIISLAAYVERMQEDQKEIYYINGPNRKAVEAGPYVEAFKNRDIEIIYTLEPIDDFVMSHLGQFDEKKLISADRADIELPEIKNDKKGTDKETEESLDAKTTDDLTVWIKEALGDKIKEVHASKRLVDSPAIIVNPDGFMTSSMERIMQAQGNEFQKFGAKNLEINPHHPLIKNLSALKGKDEDFAKSIVEQILDNALIQAGLMVEPREMVQRTYKILERATKTD
ncbi:MAG: molecular chaperone HtpG [Proteobacteria bacterium]|nr:molecular chaperone HtpG [Pseudomonadota bacterium]MBU1708947.1 molecular chaperone HtpG [Pseudomonadota bacterium]